VTISRIGSYNAAAFAYRDGVSVNSQVSIDGRMWTVERIFGSGTDAGGPRGFALRNGSEAIVAFRGTEATSTPDWKENYVGQGRGYWESMSSQVGQYIQSSGLSGVEFVGHSLGGAISQHAAYQTAKANSGNNLNISLSTINAPGAVNQIKDTEGGVLNAAAISRISGEHFFSTSDIVPRLGGGHLAGSTFALPLQEALDGFGVYTSHALKYLKPESLNAVVSAEPDYYNLTMTETDTRFGDFFGAFGEAYKDYVNLVDALDRGTGIESAEAAFKASLDRTLDAARELPISELDDIYLLLQDFGRGIVYEAYTLGVELGAGIVQLLWDVGSFVIDAIGEVFGMVGSWIDDLADLWDGSLRPNLDPLILDLNNDGITLQSMAASGVYFDMDRMDYR
jgi:pimeloyl-ACP methyl ester carboxylesterase